MGRVYVADQTAMKRRVAVKVILLETVPDANARLDLLRRFQREAMAASRLQHPNTVRVFDYGASDDGLLFLAMELLVGPSLAKVLRRDGRLSPQRTVRIGVQICKSLAEAHGQGIVHRDLKPENIILTDVAGEPDFVKVLDFGIAKFAMPGAESNLTRSGTVLGTPNYMAPEQALGQPVGPAADLYSLGVILYHCLTGKQPFSGDTPLAIMMKHAHEPPPPLSRDGPLPDVPPALERVVMMLLAKRPEDRPGPALEVARLLEEGLCYEPTPRFGTREPDATLVLPKAETRPVAEAPAEPPLAGDAEDLEETKALPSPMEVSRGRHPTKVWLFLVGLLLVGGTAWLLASTWHGADVTTEAALLQEAPVTRDVPGAETQAAGPLPDPGPEAQADEATAPMETAEPLLQVRSPKVRRVPACTSVRCPFKGPCIGPDGLRTRGEDYCPPTF